MNIVVTRTLWEEAPAFVITVAPRAEAGCRAYREILRADLFRASSASLMLCQLYHKRPWDSMKEME